MAGSSRRRGAGTDDGMVTAELAACLPVLVLLLAFSVSLVLVVAARIRLQDAATEAARGAARGDEVAGRRMATLDAPGATLSITVGSGGVVAVARETVRPLGGWLPGVTVQERAVAAREPTPGPP